MDLSVNLAGITLRNPVILAAGTAGTLDEAGDLVNLSRIGGVVTKSITREPRAGNPTWRILPERAGMLNAIGLANMGIEAFVRDVGPRVRDVPCAVFGSVAGFAVSEYVEVARAMATVPGLAAIELNVSCPNVHGGTEFGVDPGALRELVGAVRDAVPLPLVVKLSPIAVGLPGIVEVACAALDGAGRPAGPNGRPGADALTISNTIPAMAIDVKQGRVRLSNRFGGLSGPALHPIALRLVHIVSRQVARERAVPIIGAGGVLGWRDAAAFILAGASAVQMGTALFVNPKRAARVPGGLRRWAIRRGAAKLEDLVGTVQDPERIEG
ncbi:MAG: dihydroorotate dehydrogenase [Phycisphaerales bacterium]|nr:dihydroorotate dehydrogenase [Phycisphaerales bacterium]